MLTVRHGSVPRAGIDNSNVDPPYGRKLVQTAASPLAVPVDGTAPDNNLHHTIAATWSPPKKKTEQVAGQFAEQHRWASDILLLCRYDSATNPI